MKTTKKETYKLYTSDIVNLEFDPVKHVYTVGELTPPSVTGVVGILNKPALVQWSANQAGEYLAENLKAGVSLDEVQIKELVDGARFAFRRTKDKAADIGTMIHAWIEDYIIGAKPAMPVNEKMKAAIGAFLTWEKDSKVKFTFSERKIYSRKHNFAGTCDFGAVINGRKYIGDIKTSSGFYPEMFLQTAAYQLAIEEEDKTYYDGRIIVRCGKDGTLEINTSDDTEKYTQESATFLSLLQAHNYLNSLKKEKDANATA